MREFYEFFSGGGMVRAGLGETWRCTFANDFDHKKSRIYAQNWGNGELRTVDIGKLRAADLPGVANLAWASFPCQDLSLAGAGAGLRGERSGTFWPFWELITNLTPEERMPAVLVLENVCGTLSSHGGKDFKTICNALHKAGYKIGAVIVDAILFVPQSRPRLFIIGVLGDVNIPLCLLAPGPCTPWHTKSLKDAQSKLPSAIKDEWIWWNLPAPPARRISLSDVLEEEPTGSRWFTSAETERLISMMNDVNLAKLDKAKRLNRQIVGGVYKRTRRDEFGRKTQRAELRLDNVSGCLRTPAGGSSRQIILLIHGNSVRARLISTRETARLMGLPDTYQLPENYNEAYHLTGDGVVVPVVRYIAKSILEPIVDCQNEKTSTMAA